VQPFITFITSTFRRPAGLAACLASVQAQTAVAHIEHIVLPDHVGRGIVGGLFERLPLYVDAVHGRYVHLLGDDDVLADPTVVGRVMAFARAHGDPEVICVSAQKGHWMWPDCAPWPPKQNRIDLGCVITRADIWRKHVGDFGKRYEGDFDFMQAMYNAGVKAEFCKVLFMSGPVGLGKAEAA